MSILKEGFGCSDEDLFEKCEFDLLTRKALGLEMLDDVTPSLDTYYLFRRRICDYAETENIDLLKECFEQVTGEQIKLFKISGKAVRMDSKLIGSNIAWYSRYELIHKTLCRTLSHEGVLVMLSPKLRGVAADYLKEDASKTVYRSDKETITKRIQSIGSYMYQVLKRLKDDAPGYDLLHRVFHEQYIVEKGVVRARDKKAISADSVQNPNDLDASFREKNSQKVKGYVTNMTETTDEKDKPSLITSVQTEPATYADCKFLQEAITDTQIITGTKVERVYADGAYQSPDNREFAEKHDNMKLNTGRMQGGNRFILNRTRDELSVTDTSTGVIYEATYVGATKKHGKRWRIPFDGPYPYRYFTEDEVRRSELRRQIESLPLEEQNKRNNVEATMFQYSFHTRNNKTRYRGLMKHRMQAYGRCMWMNLMRLVIIQILKCKSLIFGNFRTVKKVLLLIWRFMASGSEKRIFYQSIPEGLRKMPQSYCLSENATF